MLNTQTPTSTNFVANETGPRRYLPDRLWNRVQAGDAELASQHLRLVLDAVRTYLPRYVTQARLADPQASAVSGAFAWATLMFADISGFTAMSERLSQLGREGAEVITSIVNDYFATMLEINARHGGDLFKFGGDALLVCFSGEGAAARGCQAALEMQQAMDRFAVIETAQGTFNLRMTAGLGTGTLFLASLGSPDRLEFALMGSAVKQMARAEDHAEAGEVVIDQATRDAAGAAVVADERSPSFYHLAEIVTPSSLDTEPSEPSGRPADPRLLVERLDALTPYLPLGVLERIVASPQRVMIEGEHRPVTVLFANFYGIDEIIETLGPDRAAEITAILNRHFAVMQGVINKYGGIVNKVDTYVVGHRIMAVFGAPIAHEDDPARAVHAALEMQEAMGAFADLPTSAGRFSLKQRVGVNTGYVFAGNLGSTLRQEYSVMGDVVNLASRLMGVAEEGQVIISQFTAQRVEGLFEWHEHEPVKVKGKSEPVLNYHVTQSVTGREGEATARGAFFGRQEELETARALVDRALTGHGAVLDISGDRGIGKSRLIQELSAWAGECGMTTLIGEALSYGQNIPYLPWIAVLHALFGFEEGEGENPERRRNKLVVGLDEVGLADWAPIVGGVLGVEIDETPLTASLDAQMRQQRFFDVVLQLIQERARRSPLLLVLDDMHWADVVSLDLVSYVARNVSGSALLFAIAHWPGLEADSWRTEEFCHALDLGEVDSQTSLQLARAVLGDIDLSLPLQQLILERAQGNPFFVEEVARALDESSAIQLESEEDGKRVWTIADDASGAEVPTTLAGLILSRIDRLETTNRRLLQVASVIGVTFRSPILGRVYPYGDLNGSMGDRLTELVRQDLTLFSPPDEHTFKQTLTQEVAYESLPFARRRDLHVRVGEDIEKRHSGDLAEHYGVLARHFDEGHAFDKAFVYLIEAGDKARNEFANEAALNSYRRALKIAADQDMSSPDVQAQVLYALEAMGDVYLLTSRYAEAIEQFNQTIAHAMCTARRHGDLLRKIARAHEQQGQYDEALEYLAQGRRVLSSSEQDQRSVEMACIYDLSGWVRMRRGEMELAIKECERGLEIVAGLERDMTVLRVEADLYKTVGTVHFDQGNYSQAAEVYQRSTDLRQQAGDLPGLASSYNNQARAAWAQGDMSGADDYLQRSQEINRQIGSNYGLAFGYNNLGVVSYTIGDVGQALEYYHAALSLQQRIGDNFGVAQSYGNLGEAHISLEQYAEARYYLEQAATTYEAIRSEVELSEVYRLLAEVELAQENIIAALDYAKRARRIATAIGSPQLQGSAERILARVQAQSGDVVQAIQSLEASIRLLRDSEDQIELARSHYEFGLLLARQTEQESLVREHLQQAINLFIAAGVEKEASQAQTALAQLESREI